MIKVVFCIRRRPELTREEFEQHWRDRHAILVTKLSEALGIRRYVQSYPLIHPLNSAMRATRGGPRGYDGVAELWFDSLETLRAQRSPAARAAAEELLEDERRFIDLANSPVWLVEERHVVA